MKVKFYFVFFITLFLGIEECRAIEYTFTSSYDSKHLIYETFCVNSNGGYICNLVCKSGDELDTGAGSLAEERFEACELYYGGVKSFSVDIKYDFKILTKEEKEAQKWILFKEELQGLNCDGSTNCYDYVSKTYCNNFKRTTDEICQELKKIEDQSIKVGDDAGVCVASLRPKLKDFELNINVSYNTKDYSMTFSRVNNNDAFDVNNDAGYVAYSDDRFYFYSLESNSKESTFEKFRKKYIGQVVSNNGKCSSIAFCLQDLEKVDGHYNWYAELDGECDSNTYSTVSQVSDRNGVSSGLVLDETDYGSMLIGGKLDILDCETLLGGDDGEKTMIDMLKTLVNVIKIGVPILLIGLGCLDMVQAIFSSNEEAMKKAQGKFMKRILIAVIIFLVPSVLKAILMIADGIWGNIDPSFCGILD